MSVVANHGASLRRSIDDAWAEEIRLSPMHKGIADPARDQEVIQAVLRTGEQNRVRFAQGRGGSARTMGANAPGSKGTLRIDRTRYPEIDVRVGDKVRAMDRDGQPVFEVASPVPSSHHRLIVHLNAVSG